MKPKVILALIILALAAVLLIQNTQVVTYRLYFWSVSVSQIILLPLAVLIGFIVGFLLAKLSGRGGK
ncbi:MAG: LapA family protein [Candidatus Aminicenantes bacterium]|jgi:uncharacterized integral membrane protein|nr:LapA family protein [Candidatus Aminicenantes bacterium]